LFVVFTHRLKDENTKKKVHGYTTHTKRATCVHNNPGTKTRTYTTNGRVPTTPTPPASPAVRLNRHTHTQSHEGEEQRRGAVFRKRPCGVVLPPVLSSFFCPVVVLALVYCLFPFFLHGRAHISFFDGSPSDCLADASFLIDFRLLSTSLSYRRKKGSMNLW